MKLGEGNVFTPVCHSVQRGEGGWLPSMYKGHMTHRVCLQGVVCLQESLHPGGFASRGWGSLSRGVCLQGRGWADPLRYMEYYGIQSTGGRYASYWNAFLFGENFDKNCMKMKEIGLHP